MSTWHAALEALRPRSTTGPPVYADANVPAPAVRDMRARLRWDVTHVMDDPAWKDNLLFHEYFHGDNGAGLGASHQTGWTALVADLLIDPPLTTTAFVGAHYHPRTVATAT